MSILIPEPSDLMDPIWFTTEDIVIIYMMGCFTECPECPEPFLPIPLLRLAILDIRTWASPQKTYSIPQYIPPNGSKWQFHHASIIINMEVSWNGGTPKSSIWIGFSITNQPAIGDPLMEPQISPRKKMRLLQRVGQLHLNLRKANGSLGESNWECLTAINL